MHDFFHDFSGQVCRLWVDLTNEGAVCIDTHIDSRAVIAMLRTDGWYKVAQSGSHVQFKHRVKKGRVTVPHPRKEIPAPSKLDDILSCPDYADAVAILVVGVTEPRPRTVRVNVTLAEDVLRKIDRIAKEQGMSRSSFLTHAAEKVIGSR